MVIAKCRMMGDAKRAVSNLARVEGSICSFNLHREITYFCSHYFKSFFINTSLRNDPRSGYDNIHPTLSVLKKSGRPSGICKDHWLSDAE